MARRRKSGSRKRRGRRATANQREAMRLRHSRGISLKAAWAIVKGGGSRRRKGRPRGSKSRRRRRRSSRSH